MAIPLALGAFEYVFEICLSIHVLPVGELAYVRYGVHKEGTFYELRSQLVRCHAIFSDRDHTQLIMS